jgi:hypothetical protein
MMFCKRNRNVIDGTTLEFPRTGFWLVHAVGAAGLLYLGVKMAQRRR